MISYSSTDYLLVCEIAINKIEQYKTATLINKLLILLSTTASIKPNLQAYIGKSALIRDYSKTLKFHKEKSSLDPLISPEYTSTFFCLLLTIWVL